MYERINWLLIALMLTLALAALVGAVPVDSPDRKPRNPFCDFNASLNRNEAGQLVTDLSTPDNVQAKTIAEIIQRTRPDVLLINEFDFVEDGLAAELFQDNYLSVSQNGAEPILERKHCKLMSDESRVISPGEALVRQDREAPLEHVHYSESGDLPGANRVVSGRAR
jgi:hypothetical protein